MTTEIKHTSPHSEFLDRLPPPPRNTDPRVSLATLLQQANEPIFRPAGPAGNRQLQDWSGLDVGKHALELASEVGRTDGLTLAHRFGCKITLCATDPAHLVMAHNFAKTAKVADEQWNTRIVKDLADIGYSWEGQNSFDCVIVEQAALSHLVLGQKRAVLEACARISPQILLHEFCLQGAAAIDEGLAFEVQTDLSHVLGVPVHLLTVPQWRMILEEEGCQMVVAQLETGPVRLWHPKRLLQEEHGLTDMVHAAWNALTHEELRARIWEMHEVLERHKDHLGYILLQAVRQDLPPSIYLEEKRND